MSVMDSGKEETFGMSLLDEMAYSFQSLFVWLLVPGSSLQ
jgi:hypothetical protein